MSDPNPGADDRRQAVDDLASRLPEPLRPIAELAYDYWWSWARGGREVFAAIDAHRFAAAGENPVRFLRDLTREQLDRAARDPDVVGRASEVGTRHAEYRATVRADRPVAFFCAEFAVHASLATYSGGLGVLAGDILKEASDRGLGCVGVGLWYRRGYFHQRLDRSGYQHEFWTEVDPEALPAVLVTRDGAPVEVQVPIWDEQVTARVWRVDVGRVPLYLLDAWLPVNSPVGRWITARLYDGNHAIRLAQYALLGVGGARVLRALDLDPAVVHLNEGHAALATLDIARAGGAAGEPIGDALRRERARVVFTTHTPVAAGNETYESPLILDAFSGICRELDIAPEDLLRFGRATTDGRDDRAGMTPLAMRAARTTNAVSARHGEVASAMWKSLGIPITHVTNGVHVPTWMSAPMRELLDEALGAGWHDRADDEATWAAIDAIPDADLWAVRNRTRGALVDLVRERTATERLQRGESIEYATAAERTFDEQRLTIGFARRLATYKRLHLLLLEPERALALGADLQVLIAGKAHPSDEAAKRVGQRLFELKGAEQIRGRVAFLEDYDLSTAVPLVAGCDVWLNLPRPPLEASGTSGMKAALNGGLNVSVLDGWWAEAFDGTNGWGIDGSVDDADEDERDQRDANALFDVLEREVVPLFNDRDADGIPRGWIARVKASLRTNGPRFSAGRMLRDYEQNIYTQQ
ncbi:MAG: alpha-glucan family phosphorylase [Acidimicrobiia bacterium]